MAGKQRASSIVASLVVVLVGALVAWAGSQGGVTVGSMPVFALIVCYAFVVQWLAFVPSYLGQTERYYDLTGSFTYISAIVLAVVLSGATDARSIMLLVLVLVWAGRLGPFLFRRVRRAGKDDRFDEIKRSFSRLLHDLDAARAVGEPDACRRAGGRDLDRAQGTRRVRVRRPRRVGASASRSKPPPTCRRAVSARTLPTRARSSPRACGRSPGTRTTSARSPCGSGIALIALPVLRGWQFVTLISPVFVYLLITRVSGVPLLEKKADATWGGQEAYEAYKRRTPVLVPFLGRKQR